MLSYWQYPVGITYAVIVGFLPTYYSKQLQKDIDSVSQEMIETIHSYETINEASYAIELFEAGSKVSVVILDEQEIGYGRLRVQP